MGGLGCGGGVWGGWWGWVFLSKIGRSQIITYRRRIRNSVRLFEPKDLVLAELASYQDFIA